MACRSEPGPASAVVVTTHDAAIAGLGTNALRVPIGLFNVTCAARDTDHAEEIVQALSAIDIELKAGAQATSVHDKAPKSI